MVEDLGGELDKVRGVAPALQQRGGRGRASRVVSSRVVSAGGWAVRYTVRGGRRGAARRGCGVGDALQHWHGPCVLLLVLESFLATPIQDFVKLDAPELP